MFNWNTSSSFKFFFDPSNKNSLLFWAFITCTILKTHLTTFEWSGVDVLSSTRQNSS
jgi:hypothetical protein